MSLTTPEKIRTLQRKLYCKAKAEPAFRFYVLYDKICREDILRHAYVLARGNAGAPGVDGVSFAAIETSGLEAWLAGVREELVSKTYRPNPVRRVMIPKPNGGGERPLGIPTIRDRVVHAELIPTESSIIWATRSEPDDRKIGGESSSSTSVPASVTLRPRRSERKFATGNFVVALTGGSTTWRVCSTPSFGAGLRIMAVTISRHFTRRCAI